MIDGEPAALPPAADRVRIWAATALAAGAAELRRWARQPLAWVTALVLPVAMASLISVALGSEPSIEARFAVVDLDQNVAGQAFIDEALGDPQLDGIVDVRLAGSAAEARRLIDGGDADAGIVLPRGLTAALAADPSRAGVEVIRPAGASLGADLAEMVVDLFETRARAEAAALTTVGRSLQSDPAPAVELVAPGGRSLDAATHYGPAMGLFFLLLALGFAVDAQTADRRVGLTARVAATPAPLAALGAGRALAALGIGCLSFGTTAITMQLLFARSWGPALAVAALALGAAVAFAGLAAVVASVVRTPGQAQAATAGLAFVLALASGTFNPPGAGGGRPPLAEFAPTTIALDGFAQLTTEGGGLGVVAPALASLAAVGIGGFVVSSWLVQRTLR